MSRVLAPLHPGEVLLEEFMKPHGMSAYRVADLLKIPRTRIERVIREETGMTVDTALRLSKLFGTTPDFWLNLQTSYEVESRRKDIADDLEEIPEIKSTEPVAA